MEQNYMPNEQTRNAYFQLICKELAISIVELEECYRQNLSEPPSRMDLLVATANATVLFNEMRQSEIDHSVLADQYTVDNQSIMAYYAVYKLIRKIREQKDVSSGKLSLDQYMDLQNAYDEAISASLNGVGGKHAILISALKRVGIQAMSWQEAEALAQDALSKGYSH
jgi:hypothetical protein